MPLDEAPCERDLPAQIDPVRNFRNRGAQWMTTPFEGLNEDHIFVVTADHSLLWTTACLTAEARFRRRDYQDGVKREFPGAMLRGQFEFALQYADEAAAIFPPEDVQHMRQGSRIPHELAVLFHSHSLLYAPGQDQKEVSKRLSRIFPGKYRVKVQTLSEARTDEDGVERGGLWGWGQYCSKRQVKLDFGDDNIKAFKAALNLDTTWNGNSRQIKHGGPKRLDLRPTWLVEQYLTFDEAFAIIAKEEGWTHPDHPNFELVVETPGDAIPPEYTNDEEFLAEAPSEPHFPDEAEIIERPKGASSDRSDGYESVNATGSTGYIHSGFFASAFTFIRPVLEAMRLVWAYIIDRSGRLRDVLLYGTNYAAKQRDWDPPKTKAYFSQTNASMKSYASFTDPRPPP